VSGKDINATQLRSRDADTCAMGVPGFNTWFARNNRHAYVSYFNMSWDHVYIDMASVLHGAMKSGGCSHRRQSLYLRLSIHVCLCVRSTQPSPLSQDTLCSFGLHHGFSHSSKECHVCARWTSTLGKASNTEVLLCVTPSLLSMSVFQQWHTRLEMLPIA